MSKYTYANAANCKVGLMRCEKCGKKINRGLFRYWESKNGEAYLSEHKECSLQDMEWTQIEKAQRDKLEHNKKLLEAAIEFKNKWDIDDLDELIQGLTHE